MKLVFEFHTTKVREQAQQFIQLYDRVAMLGARGQKKEMFSFEAAIHRIYSQIIAATLNSYTDLVKKQFQDHERLFRTKTHCAKCSAEMTGWLMQRLSHFAPSHLRLW